MDSRGHDRELFGIETTAGGDRGDYTSWSDGDATSDSNQLRYATPTDDGAYDRWRAVYHHHLGSLFTIIVSRLAEHNILVTSSKDAFDDFTRFAYRNSSRYISNFA